MNFKNCIKGLSIMVFMGAVCVFAGEELKDNIVFKLTPILGDTDAAAVWGIILSIVGIGGRLLLKKLPTVMRGFGGVVFWNIMKGIFGDGVVLSNNSDPEYLKRELTKKYPLLQIEIKPEAK